MSHRVNIMLDNEVWQAMQALPRGERSRLINRAIKAYMLQQRRKNAAEAEAMDALRESTRPLSGSTEQWDREDRESHWKD